jgi:hypothetical protein
MAVFDDQQAGQEWPAAAKIRRPTRGLLSSPVFSRVRHRRRLSACPSMGILETPQIACEIVDVEGA